jgi:hypothetical protein
VQEYLVAFDSTQQAIRAEMLFEYADLDTDTRPTPKEITAGCALSIGFWEQDLPVIRRIIAEEQVEIQGLYRKTENGYVSIEEEA